MSERPTNVSMPSLLGKWTSVAPGLKHAASRGCDGTEVGKGPGRPIWIFSLERLQGWDPGVSCQV